ncbi:MAG: exosortase system-associated protein, TIGR04073 family [Verrucomicrobiota bacterium]|jgi:putative exosortase-associated protein (TIGR04073 family)
MHKLILPLAAVAVALFATGCTGPEQKLGRGLSNTFEVVRWGELRRSVEQNAIEPLPGVGYYGFVHGIDRSLERAGLGVFETVTFPIPTPTYRPSFSSFYDHDVTGQPLVDPVFPMSYKPGLASDTLFETDTYTGFSGGDVAPWVPGSRFSIFDN